MSVAGSIVFPSIGVQRAAPGGIAPCSRAGLLGRPWRVLGLTLLIAILSAADLYITLLYLRSVGMSEANPVARAVMTHSSTGFLVWWKSLSVGLACGIFVAARRHRSAEVGAWLCCGVLVWLTLRWTAYSREVAMLTPDIPAIASADGEPWVRAAD